MTIKNKAYLILILFVGIFIAIAWIFYLNNIKIEKVWQKNTEIDAITQNVYELNRLVYQTVNKPEVNERINQQWNIKMSILKSNLDRYIISYQTIENTNVDSQEVSRVENMRISLQEVDKLYKKISTKNDIKTNNTILNQLTIITHSLLNESIYTHEYIVNRHATLKGYFNIYIFSVALVIVITLFFSLYLVIFRMANPIRQLAYQIKRTTTNNLGITQKYLKYNDEVGMLARSFRTMHQNINGYIISLKNEEYEKRKVLEGFNQKTKNLLSDITTILNSVTRGDFSRNITLSDKTEEFGSVKYALHTMINNFKQAITRQERLEREARLNMIKQRTEKQKIETILYSIGDGVIVIDKNLDIKMVNQSALNLAGYSEQDQVIGKKYEEIFKFVNEVDHSKKAQCIKEAISIGKTQKMANHTIIIRKDGSFLAVADSAAPLFEDDEVSGCIVVFRDVTHEREIDRMKTEFVSLASHQLRTPLTAIRWYLEDLETEEIGKLNNEQKNYLTDALNSNKRLIILVNDLLNLSRLETGRLTVDPKPTDVLSLIKETIKDFKILSKAKNCSIKISSDKKLPKINIDPDLIRQVINNLVSNSIKYARTGVQKSKLEILIGLDKDNMIIEVKDNGLGIPKENQSRIFQKFFRAENVLEQETEDNGLGLYLTKLIVDASGGKISFQSAKNRGTAFTVELPLTGSQKHSGDVKLTTIE